MLVAKGVGVDHGVVAVDQLIESVGDLLRGRLFLDWGMLNHLNRKAGAGIQAEQGRRSAILTISVPAAASRSPIA